MNPLLQASGSDLARRIRDGELSSEAVVQAHIDHVRIVDPMINAVVQDRFALAIEDARRADAHLARVGPRDLPPFFGVPCTIKEAFSVAGMPNTSGLLSRRGVVATSDGTAVSRLRAAGAIPIGVTNLSELCMWYESHNRVYGRCRNPYDPRRIAGGSSGGEGAIVGAGGSPFGLGADIGGSIRMPAFFNGVFGHKGSSGLIPNTGQHPIAEGEALRLLATGPLARRAEDLMPLVRILAGPDGIDPSTRPLVLGDSAAVDLSRLRVLDVPPLGRVSPSLLNARARALAALKERGARVEARRFPRMGRALDFWSARMADPNTASFKVLMGEGAAIRPVAELVKYALGRSPFTLPAVILALIEDAPKLTPGLTRRALEELEKLRGELADALADDAVLLFPPHPRTAPRHREPLLRPMSFAYTALFNVLELPVTQVPLGLDDAGLPVGVQVVGGHGHDHLTIACAVALESACGGWVPPPLARDAGRTHP